MKTFFTCILLLVIFSVSSYSQIRILDSNINWDTPKSLNLYLSDSTASGTSLVVKIGTTYNAGDVLSTTYTVGSNISVTDNMLVVSLASITAGEYYIDLSLTIPGSDPLVMQYKCAN